MSNGTQKKDVAHCGHWHRVHVPVWTCSSSDVMLRCSRRRWCLHTCYDCASLAPAAVFLIPRLLKARENCLLVQIIVTFSSLPLRLCLSIHVFMAHAAVNMDSFFTAVPLPGGCLSRLHIYTLLAATVFVVVAALSLLPQQEPRFLPPLPVPSFALLFTL